MDLCTFSVDKVVHNGISEFITRLPDSCAVILNIF